MGRVGMAFVAFVGVAYLVVLACIVAIGQDTSCFVGSFVVVEVDIVSCSLSLTCLGCIDLDPFGPCY